MKLHIIQEVQGWSKGLPSKDGTNWSIRINGKLKQLWTRVLEVDKTSQSIPPKAHWITSSHCQKKVPSMMILGKHQKQKKIRKLLTLWAKGNFSSAVIIFLSYLQLSSKFVGWQVEPMYLTCLYSEIMVVMLTIHLPYSFIEHNTVKYWTVVTNHIETLW